MRVWFCQQPRGEEIKQKDTAKLLWERLSALSIFSIAECSKPFISVTFCQQGNQRQWNAAGFLYGHVMQPFQRMLRCTVHTLASEFMCCFQMLRNRQGSMMNRRRQPCCQSKVNSLSIEEGKWPPGPAHLAAKQQLKCNCFWLCLHAYRTPAQLAPHVSVNSNSLIRCLPLPVDNFFRRTGAAIFDTWYREQITGKRLRNTIVCFSCPQPFALFFCLHLSTHLYMCISQLKAQGTLCQR